MTSWTTQPSAGFDLETTGADPNAARIVSASFVLLDAQGRIQEAQNWLVDPGVDIPSAATAVHGISTQRVRAEGLKAQDAIPAIAHRVYSALTAGIPVAAFNAAFDFTVLRAEMRRHALALPGSTSPVLDPFVMDRYLDRFRKGKRTLADVCAHYGVQLENAHQAQADAVAAVQLARAVASTYAEASDDASQLHAHQRLWAAELNRSLQEYFDRQGLNRKVSQSPWPVED